MGKKEKSVVVPLLTKSGESDDGLAPLNLEGAFWPELKRVGSMAAPMVVVTVSQYLLQVVSLMMVGHLGILVTFSGVAIATSFAEVTGFSVLVNSSSISSLFFFPLLLSYVNVKVLNYGRSYFAILDIA